MSQSFLIKADFIKRLDISIHVTSEEIKSQSFLIKADFIKSSLPTGSYHSGDYQFVAILSNQGRLHKDEPKHIVLLEHEGSKSQSFLIKADFIKFD